MTQGKAGLLISDGVLQLDRLADYRISRQQVFAQLRSKRIYNLGEVERMYLEASGSYSVFKAASFRPGLSVLPPDDPSIQQIQSDADPIKACVSCGLARAGNEDDPCRNCGHQEWQRAVD